MTAIELVPRALLFALLIIAIFPTFNYIANRILGNSKTYKNR